MTQSDTIEPLLTREQVATILGVKATSLTNPRYRESIGLESIQIGSNIRFQLSNVRQIIENGRNRKTNRGRKSS